MYQNSSKIKLHCIMCIATFYCKIYSMDAFYVLIRCLSASILFHPRANIEVHGIGK